RPGPVRRSIRRPAGELHRDGPGIPLPAGEEGGGAGGGVRRARAERTGAALVAAALLAAGFLLPARRPIPFDLCVLHRLTGLPCPTCGLTRSVCLFARGEWGASLAMHPAGWLAFSGLAIACLWLAAEAAAGRDLGPGLKARLVRGALAAGAVLSILGLCG